MAASRAAFPGLAVRPSDALVRTAVGTAGAPRPARLAGAAVLLGAPAAAGAEAIRNAKAAVVVFLVRASVLGLVVAIPDISPAAEVRLAEVAAPEAAPRLRLRRRLVAPEARAAAYPAAPRVVPTSAVAAVATSAVGTGARPAAPVAGHGVARVQVPEAGRRSAGALLGPALAACRALAGPLLGRLRRPAEAPVEVPLLPGRPVAGGRARRRGAQGRAEVARQQLPSPRTRVPAAAPP